ncbi:Protein arginine N-methyltransferase [Cinnamomum micranthum f. kanehirae]|uniref:Protein arginine N-methyltransferase n=1 Tax=Cinnamomum micranthum f. kanehirae TaxID=337451 RepID=A0A3S5WGI9_9MAGN|nr:Protein arginine N-methyltransferase [Cinnamomum micranthum f. kanehirae]
MFTDLIKTKAIFEEEDEEGEEQIENWDDWKTDEEDQDPDFLCLFCNLRWNSIELLFDHCISDHSFDFQSIRKSLGLDFYGSFKLINYIRSQVSENKCWSCGFNCQSNKDLQAHLHLAVNFEKDGKLPWQDDIYLKPFMQEDAVLHNFGEDEDGEDDCAISVDNEELMQELVNAYDLREISLDDDNTLGIVPSEHGAPSENGAKGSSFCTSNCLNMGSHLEMGTANGTALREDMGSPSRKKKDKNLKVSFAGVSAKEIKNVNESYFGAYSSFGIHREMLSDKVRTDSYRGAILNNPSLLHHATVMDVGCGTGILSLFAAQAGASRVIAVEASEKMATVATQIAKDNGLLREGNQNGENTDQAITVVHGMVEELEKSIRLPPHSIDVLLSEWMGYCLLYESMLSSVLYARDRWLKPGGAILPDIATIFVAGFGRGGTSIPFWENVYGFDMSCVGKEVVEDAAQLPIVDVIDSRDIVTNSVSLQTFDLATMTPDEVDFTASIELEPRFDPPEDRTDPKCRTTWCYGVVLWFDTAFTGRFCKEMPTVLSTSPYGPKTHWSQTIFTFREPIAMVSAKPNSIFDVAAAVGTHACPAVRIGSRISIARAARHRSIDVSLEPTGISFDGRKRSWPVQIFNL